VVQAAGPDGSRRDVKGTIPEMDRIVWQGRQVMIIFDANVTTNSRVAAARAGLTKELVGRGCSVSWFNWDATPAEEALNGVDDLLAAVGPDLVLDIMTQAAAPASPEKNTQAETLRKIASAVVVFSSPEGDAYARVPVRDHFENLAIRKKQFAHWLTGRFYAETAKAPPP